MSAALDQAVIGELLGADSYLDAAVHALDTVGAAYALSACACELRRVEATYRDAGDADDAEPAGAAAAQVEAWTAVLPLDPTQLAAFQSNTLFPFHATISRLFGDVGDEQVLPLLGVLGAVVGVIMAASYIDWKQSHGGYPRTPATGRTPLYAYRYSRR